jgi:hypothetical protein
MMCGAKYRAVSLPFSETLIWVSRRDGYELEGLKDGLEAHRHAIKEAKKVVGDTGRLSRK